MTKNQDCLSLTQELIQRYNQLLKQGNPNPYNKDIDEWEKEILEKVAELQKKYIS